jgi:hypothetical protein
MQKGSARSRPFGAVGDCAAIPIEVRGSGRYARADIDRICM